MLAKLGNGNVAPNPMVGAVLVYENRIIGEGYHQYYGGNHAEVNCFESVADADKPMMEKATLYVSLEPCAHYGKTPPCANRIITEKVKKVVIGCVDNFAAVNGKGIAILQQAGIEVTVGVLEDDCKKLNKHFFTFHEKNRPFITLKYAETNNHFIGNISNERLLITNNITNTWVHKIRSEHTAILVGSRTVIKDNPTLTVRLWTGKNPVRMVIDKENNLPKNLHLFTDKNATITFNTVSQAENGDKKLIKLAAHLPILTQIMQYCYAQPFQSILVEGGSQLLQLFINENLWDEAIVITNKKLCIPVGIKAPEWKQRWLQNSYSFGSDAIAIYQNKP